MSRQAAAVDRVFAAERVQEDMGHFVQCSFVSRKDAGGVVAVQRPEQLARDSERVS